MQDTFRQMPRAPTWHRRAGQTINKIASQYSVRRFDARQLGSSAGIPIGELAKRHMLFEPRACLTEFRNIRRRFPILNRCFCVEFRAAIALQFSSLRPSSPLGGLTRRTLHCTQLAAVTLQERPKTARQFS